MKERLALVIFCVMLTVGCSDLSPAVQDNAKPVCEAQLQRARSLPDITEPFVIGTIPQNNEHIDTLSYEGCVCAKIFIQPEDNEFWTRRDVVAQQVSLHLNNKSITESVFEIPAIDIVEVDAETGLEQPYIPAFTKCWREQTDGLGKRNASISFEHQSGNKDEYTWQFEVTK